MRPILLALLFLPATPIAAQERLLLPSGQDVVVQEILWDEDTQTGRFRFIAPWIAAAPDDMSAIHADMMALCLEFALPVLRVFHPMSDRLVVSFASEATEFGAVNPDIVQYFEGYTVDGQDCIWSQY